MGLADVAARGGAHRVPFHFVSGRRQPGHRFPLLRLAGLARLVQAVAQSPVVEGKAVAKQVGVDQAAAWFILDRELDAWNHPQAVPLQAAERVDPRQRVMVGEGDDLEPGPGMGSNDLGGWQFSVAEDRVQVQVRPSVGYLCQWWPILCCGPTPTLPGTPQPLAWHRSAARVGRRARRAGEAESVL